MAAWFAGRIPEGWFEGPVTIEVDQDEVQVVGTLPSPQLPEGAGEDEARVAEQARIGGFREDSRAARMRIAEEAQPAFGRAVSWGAQCGGSRVLFTTAGVPVMTRLRLADRRVLDTLIDAGVARSRSEALAWSVRLVAQHEADWIKELRDAMTAVEEVRSRGPRGATERGAAG
jgi:Arc/MetJ-type ribon-helix-helix transcriptional regulator